MASGQMDFSGPGIYDATSKEAHHPVHPCSPISVFIIPSLESMMAKLATNKNSRFLPICVAEQVVLRMTCLHAPKKDRFSCNKVICLDKQIFSA